MSLPEALEAAAEALAEDAEAIRPANGDPFQLLEALDDPAAGRVLRWMLESRPEDAEELVEAWAEQPRGIALLRAQPDRPLPKPGRKLLRRVQHRLRSQGVAVPRAAPEPTVARLPAVEPRPGGAWISPLDPSGARIAWLMEPHPAGGARLFELLLDDAQGILRLEVYGASTGRARRFLRDLSRDERAPAVEVPVEAVRVLIGSVAQRQGSERPLPRSFVEWRSHLVMEPGTAPLPGDLVREALGEEPDPARVERAVALVRRGEVGPWPPPPSVLGVLFERIRSALESPLIVSGATRQEQLAGLLGEAVGEVFDAEGLSLLVRRLRETAYVFWKRGDRESAEACLAGAASLTPESVTRSPLARALLESSLRPGLDSLKVSAPGGTRESVPEGDSPLLVKP